MFVRLIQAKALLLLTVFLSAGTSLPTLRASPQTSASDSPVRLIVRAPSGATLSRIGEPHARLWSYRHSGGHLLPGADNFSRGTNTRRSGLIATKPEGYFGSTRLPRGRSV